MKKPLRLIKSLLAILIHVIIICGLTFLYFISQYLSSHSNGTIPLINYHLQFSTDTFKAIFFGTMLLYLPFAILILWGTIKSAWLQAGIFTFINAAIPTLFTSNFTPELLVRKYITLNSTSLYLLLSFMFIISANNPINYTMCQSPGKSIRPNSKEVLFHLATITTFATIAAFIRLIFLKFIVLLPFKTDHNPLLFFLIQLFSCFAFFFFIHIIWLNILQSKKNITSRIGQFNAFMWIVVISQVFWLLIQLHEISTYQLYIYFLSLIATSLLIWYSEPAKLFFNLKTQQ